ncbi:MAG: squalene synthase HpnC [bacterium]
MNLQNYLSEITKESAGCYKVSNLADSYTFCKKIATKHYENFPVGSFLIPKELRPHFYAVYAYARTADDLGDELTGGANTKIGALNTFQKLLTYDYESSEQKHPIFYALQNTIKHKNLSLNPFQKLITAFKKDSDFKPFIDMRDLLNYCTYSANPVGELVLGLFSESNKSNLEYSDAICTALQMANFWQDISIDKNINRCYIPVEILAHFDIPLECFTSANIIFPNTSSFNNCMDYLFQETRSLFTKGRGLIKNLNNFRLKMEIAAVISGGEMILKKSITHKSELFTFRPRLNIIDKALIMVNALRLTL